MKRINFLRKHFFAGLLVVIPLGVILWMVVSIFQALWAVYHILPQSWQPEVLTQTGFVPFAIRCLLTIGVAALLGAGIAGLGWISKQYLGGKLLDLVGELIQKIPVLRSVYSSLDQLLRALAAGGGQQFSRVVYIEYPRKGIWALGFVTGAAHGPAVPEKHLNVYIPTTPNPTSGFHLIVPESDVRESHLRVEDAFKTLLSLGIAQPGS